MSRWLDWVEAVFGHGSFGFAVAVAGPTLVITGLACAIIVAIT